MFKYIIIILFLLVFIGAANYIHSKRNRKKLIDSYRWYVKILK